MYMKQLNFLNRKEDHACFCSCTFTTKEKVTCSLQNRVGVAHNAWGAILAS